jgi:phosphoglycerate dehydrogenase-like enzyme
MLSKRRAVADPAAVLVSAPYLLPVISRFTPDLQALGIKLILAEVRERLSEDELMRYAGKIDGALCGDDQFSEAVLEAFAPRLKVISKWGTGIDSIHLEAAHRLGISVRNTPDAFTDAVADSVMGYVLAFARGQPWMSQEMKAGGWNKRPGMALKECTLGVVGVGRIGQAVLRRAAAFGMALLGNDIKPIEDVVVQSLGVRMVSLDELLTRSDFASLNCDLNPTSIHLIDAERLSKMKPGAVLINTARGPIIDEPALVDALKQGRLKGAGLDVFEDEPLPAGSPLRKLDQVLLAPHNANSSPEAWERVHRSTIDHLVAELGLPAIEWGKVGRQGDREENR